MVMGDKGKKLYMVVLELADQSIALANAKIAEWVEIRDGLIEEREAFAKQIEEEKNEV